MFWGRVMNTPSHQRILLFSTQQQIQRDDVGFALEITYHLEVCLQYVNTGSFVLWLHSKPTVLSSPSSLILGILALRYPIVVPDIGGLDC